MNFKQTYYITGDGYQVDYLKSIDRKATIRAMKQYLKDYRYWKLKSLRNRPSITSPLIDDQPKSKYKSPDHRMIKHSNAQHEAFKRLDCVNRLREQEPQLGSILYYRFIKNQKLVYIAVKMNIPERTLNRYQNTALLHCALLCEDNMLVFSESQVNHDE